MDETVGSKLRTARELAGWTREALAEHSGVSRAAIEQIEAGRRVDLRISTARRLADSLGLSIDDLAGRKDASTSAATHSAYLYATPDELAEAVADVITTASQAEGAVLVVLPEDRLNSMRDAGHLNEQLADVAVAEDWTPTATSAAHNYLEYAQRKCAAGYQRVWMFGHPLERQAPQELNAWMRFESLANILFAEQPVAITCAYDTGGLRQSALRSVRETHPHVHGAAARVRRHSYVPPEEFLLRP